VLKKDQKCGRMLIRLWKENLTGKDPTIARKSAAIQGKGGKKQEAMKRERDNQNMILHEVSKSCLGRGQSKKENDRQPLRWGKDIGGGELEGRNYEKVRRIQQVIGNQGNFVG